MEQTKTHAVEIDNRSRLSASGIADVASFNEREVRASLCGGGKIIVIGESLKIDGFSKQSGDMKLSGKIYAVKYSDFSASGVKKFFR